MNEVIINKEELEVIKNVFERLDIVNLLDFGNPTDELTGLDYLGFFQCLPSVIVELSKRKEFAPFIKSLENVNKVLYKLTVRDEILCQTGYFFEVVAEAANKEAIEKYEREKEASSINKMIDEACNGLLS